MIFQVVTVLAKFIQVQHFGERQEFSWPHFVFLSFIVRQKSLFFCILAMENIEFQGLTLLSHEYFFTTSLSVGGMKSDMAPTFL